MGPYLESLRSGMVAQPILLPGVRTVILTEREDVPLQRRMEMALWGLPSGSVEMHETAFEALAREVFEEADQEVRQAEPMALYSGPNQRLQYPNGDEIECFFRHLHRPRMDRRAKNGRPGELRSPVLAVGRVTGESCGHLSRHVD